MTLRADTTTTLNSGTGGDKMDESLVTQTGDGSTQAKRPRVVIGDDNGALFGSDSPMPIADAYQRLAHERAQLSSYSKLDVNLTTRYRERVRWGDRLDLIDHRGPGGR